MLGFSYFNCIGFSFYLSELYMYGIENPPCRTSAPACHHNVRRGRLTYHRGLGGCKLVLVKTGIATEKHNPLNRSTELTTKSPFIKGDNAGLNSSELEHVARHLCRCPATSS